VARQKEIALRMALGAGRWRVVRQLLTESVLISLAGGLIGTFLAIWGTDLLVALATQLPRANEISVDGYVLAFSLAISLLTGLIFGLVPALQASGLKLNESLKEGGKSAGTGARHNRVRNLLVVGEIAIALVLLIGAGLLIQSFRRLQNVDPGFNPQNLLTLRTFLPEAKYPEEEQAGAFFERVIERVKGLPGVQAAGLTTHLPMRGGGDTYFTIEGKPFPDPKQKVTAVSPRVSDDYMRAIGIPLIKGRHFTEPETREKARVVIINETFARTYFPNEEPLGRRLVIDMGSPVTCEIIGVVRDIKQYTLDGPSMATMYTPSFRVYPGNLVVRTAGDPMAVAGGVRRVIAEVDKDQPVTNVVSMEQILATSVAQPRFRTLLLTIFAALALLLAAVGIYGVMSYAVTQRTHEIGLRIALGAQHTDVLRLVVGQGMKLALLGIAIGLVTAIALTHTLTVFLYSVTASDPLTFILVSLMLAGVAILACWIPARRAIKVDPTVALRYE
jgi:putative ABC transport system permease protein